MLPAAEVDLAAGVVVIVDDDDFAGRLKDRVRVIAIFAFEQPRQRASRVELNVAEVFGRIHFQQELPPLRVFPGTPRKFPVFRKNNAEPPLGPLLATAQDVSTLPKDSRIWSKSVFSIRNRKRI